MICVRMSVICVRVSVICVRVICAWIGVGVSVICVLSCVRLMFAYETSVGAKFGPLGSNSVLRGVPLVGCRPLPPLLGWRDLQWERAGRRGHSRVW